jgi:hypothetical protein
VRAAKTSAALILLLPWIAVAHEVITTKLTYSKEVSRVLFPRCGGCHRPEGKAFSLLTYAEARPWAKAIQETVLRRQMPPWNAVKGFGEFRNDLGLSQEEIHILSDWVEGGAPEGDAALLPDKPRPFAESKAAARVLLRMQRTTRLTKAILLGGVRVDKMATGASLKLFAVLRDGDRVPLLWLEDYSPKAVQQYELREPLRLPVGATLELVSDSPVALTLTAPITVPRPAH